MKNHPILKEALNQYNYEAAKRKATLEEPNYPSYMPPIPKWLPPKVDRKKKPFALLMLLHELRP